jgi:hypothetical protein
MATKKVPEGKKPAFVVADAKATDFFGLTKEEVFAGLIVMGIFAGPAGRAILDAKVPDEQLYESIRDEAYRMGRVMARQA